MKVINLFGSSGAGKSTIASGLFYKMKLNGYKVELVTEFAKGLIYEERKTCLEDQFYVTGVQNHYIHRLRNKVDFVITDSPILLGVLYEPDDYPNSFKQFIIDMFLTYDNFNIFLNRRFKFDNNGRRESELESDNLSIELKNMLLTNHIEFYEFDGDVTVLDKIYELIIKTL